jgi:hypothetical protein
MCWNFEISLATGIFSWNAARLLLQKKQPQYVINNAYFLILFSSMQFIDAIIWYIDVKKNNINYILTSLFIPIILILQLFVKLCIIDGVNNYYVYTFLFLTSIYLFYKFNGYTIKTNCNNGCNLLWGGTEVYRPELLLFAILLFNNYTSVKYVILTCVLFFFNPNGSIWCSLACIKSLDMLIKYY